MLLPPYSFLAATLSTEVEPLPLFASGLLLLIGACARRVLGKPPGHGWPLGDRRRAPRLGSVVEGWEEE